ncbi:polymorphic toxin-type HINT domain-containing protein [Actinoplanes sp. NPDC051470]|uniref:polymorphic toxin-type HINT domain-containing protein n=1 Tax=Actinoplanes sp. NPDC051470 TaxID=3157224 RepID=UPI00342FE4D2
MSLNGQSTPIVYDDDTNTFRPADDDSTTKIESLTGAENNTRNKEYFRVTENGVQYYFGLNRLPGWTDQKTTDSVYTVPVYQAHDGGVDDCPDGAFAVTACTLGYRFNLDYVVDLNGNAMAYYYQPEAGFYGANAKGDAAPYTRGGYLYRIDYGLTPSTIYSATAPAQVLFNTTERCIKDAPAGNDCAEDQFTVTHPEYWPDTPIDLNCARTATNCQNHGPSFWSRKRLASITTQIQSGGTTKLVDRYELTQTFPDGGDHPPTLWLDSIQRTGLSRLGEAGADLELPAVRFNPEQLPNRVDVNINSPMYHNRIKNIITEYGAETTVDYEAPACPNLPASDPDDDKDTRAQRFASTNTTGCQPIYWTPVGQPRPMIDWFHTYRVKRVTTLDRHNRYADGSPVTLITEYGYPGEPGWHYDDNELVKKKYRTWGQFRGYSEVDVTTGDPAVFHKTDGVNTHDQKTLTRTIYFRGMNGDTLPDGRSRVAEPLVSGDQQVTVADHNSYAGREFETLTYNGVGGTVDTATVTVPTIIGPTASRSRTGMPAQTAQMVRTIKSLTRQKASYGWRRTETGTFYNTTLGQTTTGMTTQVADRGETSAAGNITQCMFTRYLDGAATTLVVPAESITTDQDCPNAGATPSGNLVSHTRTSYDGNAFAVNGQTSPARPSKGNPTLVQQASSASGATGGGFIDMAATTYDNYGRAITTTRTPHSTTPAGGTTTASLAQKTYTRYTPAAGALPQRIDTVTQAAAGVNCSAVTVSSKDCHLSSVDMEQARQLPISKVDAAGQKTSLTYDALGRLTAVWLPNKNKTTGAEANLIYTYKISADSPNVVTTKTLLERPKDATNPLYATSKTLFDALLRPLETQTDGENDTTKVTNAQYDSHGRTVITNNAYAVTGAPADQLYSDRISQVDLPSNTVTDYDAAGRATQVTEQHNYRQTWFTRTAYTGDTTTVIPPTGGVATTSSTNARGQLTRLQQYTTQPALTGNRTSGFIASGGSSQDITYQYNAAGQHTVTTGPAGDNGAPGTRWVDDYDLRGRITSHVDPDTGTSLTTYDDAGNVTSTRDARGNWNDFTYDLLGRKLTATDRGQDFKIASWTYDTLRIGKLTAATRWVNGVTGGYTVAVTGYSILGKPLGQRLSLPTVERPLPVQYETSFAYTPNTELLSAQTEPTVGNLSGEKIDYRYTKLGSPVSASGAQAYVTATTYDPIGLPSLVTMGSTGQVAKVGYTYDAQTRRMQTRTLSREKGIGPEVDKTSYTYDQAGNPLSITNEQSETGNTVADAQCYRYNTLARLTQAWTSASACPDPATVQPPPGSLASGPGSYWQSLAYDKTGNRTQLIEHSTTGGADTTTSYIHGCQVNCASTGVQPDTLTATTGGSKPSTFRYNATGQLVARTPADGSPGQALTWNREGRLDEVATTGANPQSTTYLYDADGNQLIRREPGRTTLFAGNTQIVVDTTTTPKTILGASRTITHAGGAAAIRSTLPDAGNHYLLSDPHGTSTVAMDTTTQALARQQFKPYGEPRTTANPTIWPDPVRGYLGAPKDTTTGYTNLGARKYDPTLGRFISADPLLQTTDPNQLGGYTYAGNNPITLSDPSGLAGKDPRYNDERKAMQKLPDYGSPHKRSTSHGSSNSRRDIQVNNDLEKAITSDIENTAAGTVEQARDNIQCATSFQGWESCKRLAATGVEQLKFVRDISQCSFLNIALDDPGGGCGRATKTIGCTADASAEACAGHIIFFVGSIVASEGLGRLLTKAPKLPACHSFAASTPVLMADGTAKPISQVEVGDRVLATDPRTGETTERRVNRLFTNDDVYLTDLTIVTNDGVVTVHTTQHHPFWSLTRRKWVPAGQLKAGEHLKTTGRGRAAAATVRNFGRPAKMYDLTVDTVHTYYVLAGNTPVLVHNCGGGAPRSVDGKFAKRNGEPGRDGAADEVTAWEHLEMDGAIVHRGETGVSVRGVGVRKYDGTVQIDGQWYGIETKGGSAKRSPSQRAFDSWLNTPGNTVATKDGRTLVGVFDVWIDR